MKCKNCGFENLGYVKFCENCGKPFYPRNYTFEWKAIVVGLIVGICSLIIFYILMGAADTIFFGIAPSIIFGGSIASFLAYNKNFDASYDLNQLLQSGFVGLIIGSIIFLVFLSKDSSGSIFMIFIPLCASAGFFGGSPGALANILRQKNELFLIPYIIIILIIIAALSYIFMTI